MAINITTEPALLRLMQLSSASLPVGGYSFSQGLEYAVEAGWIKSSSDTLDWLSVVMNESLARTDLPLLMRLAIAVQQNQKDSFDYWNAHALACRETKELLLTETAMGSALVRLIKQLDIEIPLLFFDAKPKRKMSFVAAFAATAVHWKISKESIAMGYLWSWLENQVAAATKLVPLGQTAAQALLIQLSEEVPAVLKVAESLDDHEIGSSLPGLAMASAWHETQYSRLFRS